MRKFVIGAVVLAAAFALVRNLDDLRRYVRISRM
ncbi:DUF6893 family small protein [Kitasatospora sp. NPDC058170]